MKANSRKSHEESFATTQTAQGNQAADFNSLSNQGCEAPVVIAHAIGLQDRLCVQMSSSCGEDEGHAAGTACPSYVACEHCVDTLHELANLITGVLINAQVLGWKLPPYSHLKRPVRELERNAQRGGELLKRLMQRCAAQG